MKNLTPDRQKTPIRIGKFGHATFTAFFILLFLLLFRNAEAEENWPKMTFSQDDTPISYESYGSGETTLIFVHGWSCDGRYWREQVPYFAKKFHVLVLDLAGHGHSGLSRKTYTMQAFGRDVKAVAETAGENQVILIGHSMGGPVIIEAARLMPKKVIGMIPVDTLQNVEYPLTKKEYTQMVAPMKADFRKGVSAFVQQMIRPGMDPALHDWILKDMASAPSTVALSAIKQMMAQYIKKETAKRFEGVDIPIVAVNADLWPVDFEANRRHMTSFEAITIENSDHFLMMDRPKEFNRALKKAIQMILKK